MKRLRFLATLLLCLAAAGAHATHGNGEDDSIQADLMASCNASFHQNCVVTLTESTTGEAHAAPIGNWGGSLVETLVIVTPLAIWLLRRSRRGQVHS
jgi:hypothetical protein